jgi:hypothetical protein
VWLKLTAVFFQAPNLNPINSNQIILHTLPFETRKSMSDIETEKKVHLCAPKEKDIHNDVTIFPLKRDSREENTHPDGFDDPSVSFLASNHGKNAAKPAKAKLKKAPAPFDDSSISCTSLSHGKKGKLVKAKLKKIQLMIPPVLALHQFMEKKQNLSKPNSKKFHLSHIPQNMYLRKKFKATRNLSTLAGASDESSLSSVSFNYGKKANPVQAQLKKATSSASQLDSKNSATEKSHIHMKFMNSDDVTDEPPMSSATTKQLTNVDVYASACNAVPKPDYGTTPMKVEEKKLSLEHHKNFIKKAYNVLIPSGCCDKMTIDSMVVETVSKRTTSKTLTPKELAKRIHIIKNWENGGDGFDVKKFHQKNKIGYRLIKSQHSVKANQDGKLHLYNAKNQVYVNVLQVFDLISECHFQVGCLKITSTKNAVDSKYANISREEVQAFVQTCKYCSHDQVARKRITGAVKPIISLNFRERFQVDLIDYREDEQTDVYGLKMRWLLVLKDHLTRLCYLKPLPNKKSKYVAHELYHIFGLIGHPLVLQSDNGKEFTGSALLDMLYELDPGITTVHGRPRTPRDQGSVERLNQTVKRIISKQVMNMNDAFPHKKHSWITVYPLAMSAMNSAKTSRGQYDASPYESVFGLKFHEPILQTATVQQLRENKTVESRVGILGSVFKAKMISIKEIDDDDDDDGGGSGSGSHIPDINEDEQSYLSNVIKEKPVMVATRHDEEISLGNEEKPEDVKTVYAKYREKLVDVIPKKEKQQTVSSSQKTISSYEDKSMAKVRDEPISSWKMFSSNYQDTIDEFGDIRRFAVIGNVVCHYPRLHCNDYRSILG